MSQLLTSWNAFSLRQRIILVLVTLVVFASVLGLARMAAAPSMVLLYSGLENGAAGEVVRTLEQRGIAYRVRGGSIYVDARSRDELRMTLASEGLPATGNKGYEILDSLSGFGTTSQMFDAAYWRAKEGELARTIVGASNVESARVHIAHAGSNPFQKHVAPTASITVTPRNGEVSGEQARAFRFLVASAVAGLSVEDVAVIDSTGRLIGGTEQTTAAETMENRARLLSDKVRRLLEARVGPGNVVVELSIDTVTETESIREHLFDPGSRVAISTDSEERSTNSRNSGEGLVTVASNLPDGDAAGAGTSSNQDSETRERVNYEVSETQREVTREAGAIRRITAAVLVNDMATTTEEGRVEMIARPPEELAILQELVESAIGYDSERGDVVTLRAMRFEPVLASGTPATSSLFNMANLDIMSLLQMAVLGLVALLLGLFVLRPLLTRAPTPRALTSPEAGQPPLPLTEASSALEEDLPTPPLTGEIQPDSLDFPDIDMNVSLPDTMEPQALDTPQDPVDRLRSLIADRQDETVEILRSWMEDKEERT